MKSKKLTEAPWKMTGGDCHDTVMPLSAPAPFTLPTPASSGPAGMLTGAVAWSPNPAKKQGGRKERGTRQEEEEEKRHSQVREEEDNSKVNCKHFSHICPPRLLIASLFLSGCCRAEMCYKRASRMLGKREREREKKVGRIWWLRSEKWLYGSSDVKRERLRERCTSVFVAAAESSVKPWTAGGGFLSFVSNGVKTSSTQRLAEKK